MADRETLAATDDFSLDGDPLEIFRRMEISYGGLVIESTTRCNAKCAMCYQYSGPKGSDTWGIEELTVADLEPAIRDAMRIETLTKRFHLAGGESFLDRDANLELFAIAKDAGYTDITTTTNGYWAKTVEDGIALCTRLREAGLQRVELSWDYWHLPYIQPEVISNCIDACSETGIGLMLRVLTTKSHSVDEALAVLRPESVSRIDTIYSGPVFQTGRAAETIEASDFYKSESLDRGCHEVLNLTINAKGDISPCCAGFDQTDTVPLGNIRDESIVDIAARMNESALLRVLVFGGPKSFVPLLRRAGIEIELDQGNICQLCWDIFSNPEYAKALTEHFGRLERISSSFDELRRKRRAQAKEERDVVPVESGSS